MKKLKWFEVIQMNKVFCILVLSCGLFSSCHGAEKPIRTTHAVMRTDSCLSDSHNRYEVYIPERAKVDDTLPMLLILDAHGAGRFALKKFILAANQYHLLLVASDVVKNDVPNYVGIIETMVQDVRQKYPVNNVIFIAGFSGGARMALGFALTHSVNGLLLSGALADPKELQSLHCPVISISGMDDFNFIETAQYLFPIKNMPSNLKIELTHASHDWPDSLLLADEVGFLRFSGMSDHSSLSQKADLHVYEQKQQKRMDALIGQDNFLQAVLIAHNMASTFPFDTVTVFNNTYSTLTSNPNFQHDLTQLRQSLEDEMNLRQFYLNSLLTQDKSWWQSQINHLQQNIISGKDSYIRDMYKRVKAFLGIVCYSAAQQAVHSNDDVALEKILIVYRLLEPHNPDMFYFSAFIPYRKGDDKTTLFLLKQALVAGFSDQNRLKEDFPLLRNQLP